MFGDNAKESNIPADMSPLSPRWVEPLHCVCVCVCVCVFVCVGVYVPIFLYYECVLFAITSVRNDHMCAVFQITDSILPHCGNVSHAGGCLVQNLLALLESVKTILSVRYD